MADKSGNHLADIHDSDYEAQYLTTRLDRAGLVSSAGRSAESLNGQWNFGADWYDTCRRAKWFLEKSSDSSGRPMPVDWDWEGWERMKVPACWNMERTELHYFEGSGVYTRTFRYIPERSGERAFLRFEGVAYRATVFLNGVLLGTHDGASTPFCAEITGSVKAENRIVVVVETRRRADRVPMENTDWFNYGGIYRDVLLLRTPAVFIKDWFVRLVPDGSFGTIELDVEVSAPAGAAKGAADGEARLRIAELGIDAKIAVSSGKGKIKIAAKPVLWSPENPKLYDVELSFAAGKNAGVDGGTDKVADRIGLREIRVEGRNILLNGKSIFLKGICVHEDHLETGKTTDEATIRSTIAHLKEMNGNYFRLAHYPHDGRFARIADELGVLLWEEVPVYWAIAFNNQATYADAENQLAELVLRDRNRASVVIWSVGNENDDTDARLSFMSRLAAKYRELDGTRPISAACLINHEKLMIEDRLADSLDIIGVNEYYGWYDPDFSKLPRILENSVPSKPVVLCEFGGDARLGQRGSVDDLWTEDKQARLYEKQVEVIGACPYIKGTTPWILYDFRCPRRLNRYQELFNRKGLIDADRKTKKLAFKVMADFYKSR
ncbi:MAG: glycoside hydrolase family 2 TIM barrel-domain containing protein [Treponemataceae bacterium]